MRVFSLLFFLLMTACTTVKYKDTYLKYSGYMDGCADAATEVVLILRDDLTREQINNAWLDAMCMELYLIKLEQENIKPHIERLDRNEAI